MPKSTYRAPIWFCRLVVVVSALLLLAACGSNNTSNTGTATTPTVAQPTLTPSPTATPTAIQPTPTVAKGSPQIVTIITESNGSFAFSPTTLTITAGTTVIWKNMSSAPHTVTSDDGKTFDSGTMPIGGTFRFTFTTSGTFPYHCNYHPYMRATIGLP